MRGSEARLAESSARAYGACMSRLVVTMAFAALVAIPAASAARPPTLKEREEITRAVDAYWRNAPVECVYVRIRISNNSRYAMVVFDVLNWRAAGSRCARYLHNGFTILRKARGKWTRVYVGSDGPPCSLKVPRDLVACRRG